MPDIPKNALCKEQSASKVSPLQFVESLSRIKRRSKALFACFVLFPPKLGLSSSAIEHFCLFLRSSDLEWDLHQQPHPPPPFLSFWPSTQWHRQLSCFSKRHIDRLGGFSTTIIMWATCYNVSPSLSLSLSLSLYRYIYIHTHTHTHLIGSIFLENLDW